MSSFRREISLARFVCVPRVVLTKGVFQSYYTEVPKSPNGFVYYIQATKKFSCKVVGFMRDVKNELLSFNDLSKATNSYQPFALMCFIAGFREPGDGEQLAFNLNHVYHVESLIVAEVISSMEQASANLADIDRSSLLLIVLPLQWSSAQDSAKGFHLCRQFLLRPCVHHE